MSVAVHLVVGAAGEARVHDSWIVTAGEGRGAGRGTHKDGRGAGADAAGRCLQGALRTVLRSTDSVLARVPADLSAAAAVVLAQAGRYGRLARGGAPGAQGAQGAGSWRPALDLGVVLLAATTQTGRRAGSAAARGTLALAADGRELSAGVQAVAIQSTHADGSVAVLLLQHRPFEIRATHAVATGPALLAPPGLLPRDPVLVRALAHKHKRTLQKAQHAALVRSVVPVLGHLDASLARSAYGVLWKTTLHDVDFYSVFA